MKARARAKSITTTIASTIATPIATPSLHEATPRGGLKILAEAVVTAANEIEKHYDRLAYRPCTGI
ncbi:MAG: hypothetical protein ACJAWL_003718 [Motiliproteus sp.]